MDLNNIENSELLYRAVLKSYPERFINGRPSAALFIDEKGASVERDGGREEISIVATLQERFKKHGVYEASLRLSAGECRDVGTFPNPIYNRRNPYHAEIHDSPNAVKISLLKAMRLAACCKIIK